MRQPLSEGGRIGRNFAALTGAQAVSALAGLVSTAFVARMLGTEAFGILGFGIAMLSYFGLLVTLGTDMLGTREIAQNRDAAAQFVHRLLGLRTVSVAVVSIVYVVAVGAMGLPERTRIVLWIQGAGLLGAAYTLDFVFQGLQRMGAIAARQISASLMSLAIVLLFVRGPDDVYIAAAAPVAATLLAAGWLAWRLHTGPMPLAVAFEAPSWTPMLRAAAPIAVSQLMSAVFFYIDIVMLGFMSTQHLTGVYVGMSRILAIAVVACGLIHAVFLPVVAGAWPAAEAMRARYRDVAVAALLIGAPAACMAMAFPRDIIMVLFGEAYLPGATALVILMAMAAAALLAVAPTAALLSWHDQNWQMIAFSAGGASNFALNLVLIPRYGIEGAAVATLLAQLIVLAVAAARVRRRFGLFGMGPAFVLLAAAGASALATRWVVDAALPDAPALGRLAAAGIIGGAAFLALAAASGVVPLRRLRGMIRRD